MNPDKKITIEEFLNSKAGRDQQELVKVVTGSTFEPPINIQSFAPYGKRVQQDGAGIFWQVLYTTAMHKPSDPPRKLILRLGINPTRVTYSCPNMFVYSRTSTAPHPLISPTEDKN